MILNVLGPMASLTTFGLLYYFVFEMMFIVAMLKSTTHTEMAQKASKIRACRMVVLGLHICIQAPMTIWIFASAFNKEYYLQHLKLARTLIVIKSVERFPVDAYMIY